MRSILRAMLRRVLVPAVPLALLALLCVTPALPQSSSAKSETPRLVVLLVFDQLRGDYLNRWQDLFVKDGFRRLQKEGAWYRNCHYPYALTLTAPGHASMATGVPPREHGIVANDWYDRNAEDEGGVNAVRSVRYHPVPAPAGAPRAIAGAAPVLRRRQSVGDWLATQKKGKGKRVSLSIKDRAAILLAALLRGQICYWFSTNAAQFVTSDYYTDRLHSWVDQFNKERMADQWYGKDWTRLLGDLDYAAHSGPDDVAAEGVGYAQGRTFPHKMTGGKDKLTRSYYEAMNASPYSSELLLALAKRAIEAEKLGQGDAADLLTLSFSSNDLIGHCYGPDSQEVLDVTLRSDRLVKDLLDYLDVRVGKGRYMVVVCADHGVCPIPEVAKAKGKDAGRVDKTLMTRQANAFLDATFGKAGEKLQWVEAAAGHWIYLNRGVLKERGVAQARVEEALARWVVKQEGIQAAYTRTQLTKGALKSDALGESVRLSFDPERSGDVAVIFKPYWILGPAVSPKYADTYRTTHGTPHAYDTHVPLLVFGPGVRAGVRDDRVTPLAVAAILARGLGVTPPEGVQAVPKGLFK